MVVKLVGAQGGGAFAADGSTGFFWLDLFFLMATKKQS